MVEPDLVRVADFVARRLTAQSQSRYAVVLTGNQHDAEDLRQEALTRTARAWRRVRAEDPERYVRTTMARIMVERNPAGNVAYVYQIYRGSFAGRHAHVLQIAHDNSRGP
ncbi:MAG: sigma factor [Acidimicrobiales bacterium]